MPRCLPRTHASYELQVVLRHEGARSLSGHYTTDVRTEADGKFSVDYELPAPRPAEAWAQSFVRRGFGCPEEPAIAAAVSTDVAAAAAPASTSVSQGVSRPRHAEDGDDAAERCVADSHWVRYDDSTVLPKTWADVSGRNGRKQAYVLLYRLREDAPAGSTSSSHGAGK